jgi:hypothetical protein
MNLFSFRRCCGPLGEKTFEMILSVPPCLRGGFSLLVKKDRP